MKPAITTIKPVLGDLESCTHYVKDITKKLSGHKKTKEAARIWCKFLKLSFCKTNRKTVIYNDRVGFSS